MFAFTWSSPPHAVTPTVVQHCESKAERKDKAWVSSSQQKKWLIGLLAWLLGWSVGSLVCLLLGYNHCITREKIVYDSI